MHNFIVFLVFSSLLFDYAQSQPTTRVAGSTITEINKYPFAVALLSSSGGSTYLQACGGVILTGNTVLSVASCFQNSQSEDPASWWRARVGSTYSNAGGTVHLVQQIIGHENFNYDTRVNDIAVVKLSIAVTYSVDQVSAALIAGSAYVLNTYQQVTAIGWGVVTENGLPSTELRETDIWVVNNDICGSRYNEVGFNVNDDMACVGWLDVGVRGQCQGDNGSPILIDGVVVGLYSWSEGCANYRYPGINTRISSHTNWIVNTALQN